MTTRIEVEVIYTLTIDVPCDQRDDDGLRAKLAVGVVKRATVPQIAHPQTGELVNPEIWCYGDVRQGCPKTGYKRMDTALSDGLRITRLVRR